VTAQATWRNRIVGEGEQPASQFIANPGNWRTHPQNQRDAMRGALNEVGWVQRVIVNRQTGYLVDGHERVWQALQNGDASVPYVEVDLSPEEESYVLATLDPIGAMAVADREQLDALLREVQSGEAGVQAMLAELAEKSGVVPGEEEEDAPPDLSAADVPDALFATDNEWGVPTLDLAMQAQAVDMPVTAWGSIPRTSRMAGTWHFYVDDYRFEALWADPSPVVNSRCVNAVEPNCSTNPDMPRAVALWGVFRKRWIARWWQSHGVRVFVDLNVEPEFAALNLLGVPRGWTAYATRWLDRYGEGDVVDQHARAREHAGGDVLFVVIGGRGAAEEACQRNGWVWIREYAGKHDG
jgi:hypothetical protein